MTALAALYLGEVLELDDVGWRRFLILLGVYTVPALVLTARLQAPIQQPLLDWLRGDRSVPNADLLAQTIHMPRRLSTAGFLVTSLCGTGLALNAWFWIDGFGLVETLGTTASSLGVGLMSGFFSYLDWKRASRPAQREISRSVAVAERGEVRVAVPLRTKLQIAFVATSVLPVLLSVVLVHAERDGIHWPLLAVAGLSGAFALTIAWGFARELTESTEAMVSSLERIVAGDLRETTGHDSDDELGVVARACDRVVSHLADLVRTMGGLADALDAARSEIDTTASQLVEASGRQSESAGGGVAAVSAIQRQVAGIADQSRMLNDSVQESSAALIELGATGEEIREVTAGVSGRIDSAVAAVEQLAGGSASIRASVEGLSRSATEAHTATLQLAEAAGGADAQAQAARELATGVAELSSTGRRNMNAVLRGIESISNAVSRNEAVTSELRENVGRIGAVVTLIDDVAGETQLLSLNAAIIAAQAGERGRSFAVVASEVKQLAARVSARTSEISELIEAIERTSEDATTATGDSRAAVESGLELSTRAGQTLEEIHASAERSGEHASAIEQAMREQNEAARHLRGIAEVVADQAKAIESDLGEQGAHQDQIVQMSGSVLDAVRSAERTTAEQAQSLSHLRDGVVLVEEASGVIREALAEQSSECERGVTVIEDLASHARGNAELAGGLASAIAVLEVRAASLREVIARFEV